MFFCCFSKNFILHASERNAKNTIKIKQYNKNQLIFLRYKRHSLCQELVNVFFFISFFALFLLVSFVRINFRQLTDSIIASCIAKRRRKYRIKNSAQNICVEIVFYFRCCCRLLFLFLFVVSLMVFLAILINIKPMMLCLDVYFYFFSITIHVPI